MSLRSAFLGALAATATLLGLHGTAHAVERPFTLDRATVGAGLRYGTENLNLGLGARGGYTLREQIYIGGVFDYWFGESDKRSVFGSSVEASSKFWNLIGVVGYDVGLTPDLVVRPFAGFGIIHGSVEACSRLAGLGETCLDDSETDAAGLLGGELIARFGSIHFGGEFRILIADDTAAIIGANVGTDFYGRPSPRASMSFCASSRR